MAIPIPESKDLVARNLLVINALAHAMLEATKRGLINQEQLDELYLHGLRQEDSQELIKLL